MISNDNLLGQWNSLQGANTNAVPSQYLPPLYGKGLLHVLDLAFCPKPHVLSHSDQTTSVDQFPSPSQTKNAILTYLDLVDLSF